MIKRLLNKLGIYRAYTVCVGNTDFKIPIYKDMGFTNLNHAERWMIELLATIGTDNMIFVDVGANIGQTLLAWKANFKNAKYIGFEPNPFCVEYIGKLVAENNLTNCILEPYAISTITGKQKLFLLGSDPVDSSATSIADFRDREVRKAIETKTISFSNTPHRNFDLIKIDVEGAELEVIQSVFEITKEVIIICEVLPVYSHENNPDRYARQQQIEHLLDMHDYKIYRIVKKNRLRIVKIHEFGIHDDIEACDYLFIPDHLEETCLNKF